MWCLNTKTCYIFHFDFLNQAQICKTEEIWLNCTKMVYHSFPIDFNTENNNSMFASLFSSSSSFLSLSSLLPLHPPLALIPSNCQLFPISSLPLPSASPPSCCSSFPLPVLCSSSSSSSSSHSSSSFPFLSSLSRLMETAREMIRESLPIKCLEAVILGMYPFLLTHTH